jgi:hypothetical protein
VELVSDGALVPELTGELEALGVQRLRALMIAAEPRSGGFEVERARLGCAIAGRLCLRTPLAGELHDAEVVPLAKRSAREPGQAVALPAQVARLPSDAQTLLGPRARPLLIAGTEGEEMIGVEHARTIDGSRLRAASVERRSRGTSTPFHVARVEPRLAPDLRNQCERFGTVIRLRQRTDLGKSLSRLDHGPMLTLRADYAYPGSRCAILRGPVSRRSRSGPSNNSAQTSTNIGSSLLRRDRSRPGGTHLSSGRW